MSLTTAQLDAMDTGPKTTAELDALDRAGQQPGGALAEQTLNTITAGISGKLEGDYYKARGSPDLMKLREQANPIASGVGDVMGLLSPVGEAAAISKVAKGVSEVAKTVKVARRIYGATEGGLWGLSAAMNEDHMVDPRMSAEVTAAQVVGSALAGVALHSLGGAASDYAKSGLIKAFGGKALKESLGSMAEEAVMRSVAGEKDYAKRNLENRKNEVARFALDNGFIKGAPSMKTAAGRADERASQALADIQQHLDVADTLGTFDPAPVIARMEKKLAEMDNNPVLAEKQAKLQAFVDRFKDTGSPGTPAQPMMMGRYPVLDTKTGQPVMSPAVPGTPGTAPTSFNKAWETMRAMGPDDKDLYRLRGELQDEIFKQAEAVDPKLATLKAANREHANALEFRTLAENKAAKQGQYNVGDVGAGMLGLHVGVVPGLLLPVGKRLARERGGFVAASALEALAQNGTLPKIADAFKLLMKSRLADPSFGGAFRAVLETAAAKGSEDLLKTHLSLAQQDPEYMMTVGLEPEDPATVAAHTDRAHRLATLSNVSDEASAGIDQSVARVLGEQPGRAPKYEATSPTRAEFDKAVKRLEILASNAENDKSLADLAPTTATLAHMSTQNAATFLLGKAPKDPTAGLPPALRRPWNPSKGELRDWFRMVDVVASPRAVLDAMRQGQAHQSQIEALQTVYPRLFREFQDKMQSRLSAWTQPIDRRRRAQVGLLLGDLTDPAVTSLIQAAHLRAIPPPAPPPDGRQKIDPDRNEQTQAQRLEEK